MMKKDLSADFYQNLKNNKKLTKLKTNKTNKGVKNGDIS